MVECRKLYDADLYVCTFHLLLSQLLRKEYNGLVMQHARVNKKCIQMLTWKPHMKRFKQQTY